MKARRVSEGEGPYQGSEALARGAVCSESSAIRQFDADPFLPNARRFVSWPRPPRSLACASGLLANLQAQLDSGTIQKYSISGGGPSASSPRSYRRPKCPAANLAAAGPATGKEPHF